MLRVAAASTALRATMGASSALLAVGTARRAMTSTALEQAMRITTPSQAHPATGKDAADTPTEARVVWREHWDIAARRPYYHNLVTNHISWSIPDGFPTRFLFYYRRLADEVGMGHTSPEHMQVHRVAHDVAAAGGSRTIKERLKDYGAAGFILYGIVHFGSLAVVFLLLWTGVDVAEVARGVGFDLPKADASSGGSLVALWLLAVAVNKIFSPLHLVTTLALAPKVAPVMRRTWLRVYGSKVK